MKISDNVTLSAKIRFPLPKDHIGRIEITNRDMVMIVEDMCDIFRSDSVLRTQLKIHDLHAVQQCPMFYPHDCE